MNRLTGVLEASLLRIDPQTSGARWKAAELAKDVYNSFGSDSTLADMLRSLPSPDSLPLCAEPEPEPVIDLMAALEASLAAVKERRA